MINGIWQSLYLDLVNINVYAKFDQNIPKSSRDRASFTFFRIWISAKPRSTTNDSDNPLDWILSISMCLRDFITIFHSVQEVWSFSLFQNLDLGIASTDDKCHFTIPLARSCQYQCVTQFYQNIPNGSRFMNIFRKLIWNGHTTSQTERTDQGQITQKAK